MIKKATVRFHLRDRYKARKFSLVESVGELESKDGKHKFEILRPTGGVSIMLRRCGLPHEAIVDFAPLIRMMADALVDNEEAISAEAPGEGL